MQFNPNAPENLEDPYPAYRRLRDDEPLHHNAELGLWVLSRYADVQSAARNYAVFSSAEGVDPEIAGSLFGPGYFINSDPPWHDILRKVVRDRFTPRAVKEYATPIEASVSTLLAPLLEQRGGDIAVGLAQELPIHVVSELLGVPVADRTTVSHWHKAVFFDRRPGELEMTDEAREALPPFADYFRQLARERRKNRQDDLISELAAAKLEGPWAELADEIVVGLCLLLFSAGTETTHGLLGNAFLLLGTRPENRRLLADDPSQIPALVEEVVRFESPVQNLARTTTCDVELHGGTIPEGERVLLLFGSANRDGRYWPDPDRFDPAREPKRHLGFGEGIHFCLGAPFARLEARIALEAFFAHVVDYEVCGPVVRSTRGTNRGLHSLPIAW
jgi:cytochrome P450